MNGSDFVPSNIVSRNGISPREDIDTSSLYCLSFVNSTAEME